MNNSKDEYIITLHSLSAVARALHTNTSRIVRAERKYREQKCGGRGYSRRFFWGSPLRYDVRALAHAAGLIA